MKKKLLLYFILLLFSNKNFAQINAQDSLALVALYNSTNGANWTNHNNWLTGPVKTWYGVALAGDRVDKLQLANNNLVGKIAFSVRNLSFLSILDLSNNTLTGAIPIGLGNSRMTTLKFDHNYLESPITSSLCTQTNLTTLSIAYNNFTFAGIECFGVKTPTDATNYVYGPQRLLPLNNDISTLSVSAGGNWRNNNTYYWYKDNVLNRVTQGDTTFDVIGPGAYYAEVKNRQAPGLTLLTETIIIGDALLAARLDSLALIELYNNTDGAKWTNKTNWLSAQPISSWYGIIVMNKRITSIRLRSNNLRGPFPFYTFGDLTALQYLDLSQNDLGGGFPEGFGNLTELRYFNIKDLTSGFEAFSGSIPESIGNLTKLEYLNLSSHSIGGEIPAAIGNLKKLKTLDLSDNQLMGKIPNAFATLPLLDTLLLHINNLNGAVPASLCTLNTLTKLSLDSNLLSFDGMECIGTVDAQPGKDFSYPKQKKLQINTNNLVLSVTAGGTLANNTYRWFKDNTLYKTIIGDSSLALTEPGIYTVNVNNSKAPQLTLNSNSYIYFAAVNVKDSLCLVALYNSMGGPGWKNKNNWLKGQVGSWYGVTVTGTRVTKLWLDQNNLTGQLPDTLGALSMLDTLNISGAFSSTIPSAIGRLTNLKSLRLGSAQLTGSIPSSFGNLANLRFLGISYSGISGSIPSSLGNLSMLEVLDLSYNYLTGSIPESLSNLSNLYLLFLSKNQLAGPLPSFFGEKPGFVFFVNNNQLSGPIPESFCNNLYGIFSISYNQFNFDGLECVGRYIQTLPNDGTTPSYEFQKQLTINNKNPVISLTAGGTLSNNTYTWYKDNDGRTPYKIITGDSTLTLTEPGKYWARVSNKDANMLILFTDTVEITEIVVPSDLQLKAEKCSRAVCIQWEAEQQYKRPIAYFEVEKSNDGTHFRLLDRIKAGKRSGSHVYRSKDYFPKYGALNYYRIKQINKDGTQLYSPIVSIEISKPAHIIIWPNPADDFIYFKGVDHAQKILLYDLSGRIVKQWQDVNSYQRLSIVAVRRGLYLIRIVHEDGEYLQLLIIR